MDVNEQDYLKWVNGNKSHMVNQTEKVEFELLYKYGIPDFFVGIYLFDYEQMEAGEELKNCYLPDDYGARFYKRNKGILEDKIVVAQYLGSKICVNSNLEIVKIDYSDFYEWFVNTSFEEFIKFLLIIDELAGRIENHNMISLSHEVIEAIEDKMKEVAESDWDNYSFWQFLLKSIDEETEYY